MTRLLAIGHAVRPTGFARVLASILGRLTGDFEVLQLGLDHRGDPVVHPFAIEPNRVLGDPFGATQLPELLGRFRPDVVLMCHDHWLYPALAPVIARHADPRPPVVFYCPIEFAFADDRLASLAAVDRLVAYTGFGRDILRAAIGERPIDVIPHGVDADLFHPRDRRAARAALFADRPELADAFIVLNANRNCPRKRIDLTLQAFAAFARGKDDVYLYLHMGMRDVGVDVLALAGQLGIGDRLLVTTREAAKPAIDDDRLGLIYGACDVGLNTATGEGFGLVALEHAATGAAQVVPDHSACAELWAGAASLVAAGPDGVVDVAGVAAALDELYRDPALRARRSAEALARATADELRWSAIAARWGALLREVAGRRA